VLATSGSRTRRPFAELVSDARRCRTCQAGPEGRDPVALATAKPVCIHFSYFVQVYSVCRFAGPGHCRARGIHPMAFDRLWLCWASFGVLRGRAYCHCILHPMNPYLLFIFTGVFLGWEVVGQSWAETLSGI
jgi:hypothetical protein